MITRHPPIFAFALATALALTACGRPEGLPASVARAPGALRAADAPAPPASPAPTADVAEVPADVTLLPRFTRTGRGRSGDPVNLVIAGTERQIVEGFDQAGWLPADPITLWTALRMVRAGVTRGDYATAPMSALYLFGRTQDLAYQKNPRSIIARDHLRVWKSPVFDPLGRPYWVVAATKDVAVYWNKTHSTHRIDPDIDAERQLVVDDWLATGRVARTASYLGTEPGYRGTNGEGDPFFTDGRVVVLDLVEAAPVAAAAR